MSDYPRVSAYPRLIRGHHIHELQPRALVVRPEQRAAVAVDGPHALERREELGVDGAVAEGRGVARREGVAVQESRHLE